MADPIVGLNANMEDVRRLLKFHREEAGSTPGRKYGVEVLNKSGIVLTLACWEAFVEDCATSAFDYLLTAGNSPNAHAEPVRRLVARQIKEDKNELAVWKLAGDGWRSAMGSYRDAVVKKYVGPLNTPSAQNTDSLFLELIGLADLSKSWMRHKMTSADAAKKLQNLITLRGDIAHRVSSKRSVKKKDVSDGVELVSTLAGITSNRV